MPKRRWNSKALAERRRRAFHFYLAGFTQEEIAEKIGVDRSVVSRDLQSVRESACPGESPDVQEACFIQMAKLDQLEHANWVGLDGSKVEKRSRTTLHIPEHANTSQHDSRHANTSPNMPAHSRTVWNRLLRSASEGPNTFPRLRFGLVSHTADVPFLTACGIARQIMESRIQLARFEAASAAFSAKRCQARAFRRVHWEGCVVFADRRFVSPPKAARRRADRNGPGWPDERTRCKRPGLILLRGKGA